MEVIAIIAAMAAGAHYLNKDDVSDNVVHSSQTTAEISRFQTDIYNELNLASIDWSKAGNSIVGDSSENGIQWVFITN
jgi:glyceraldehyde-3-phosphate dehydrogenase/erythrose-4-phosphate dehydrogenase